MAIDQREMQLIARNAGAVAGTAVGAAAAVGTVAIMEQPASAAGVDDVASTVTSLGTLAGAALVVALVPFGLYFAFKIVRKVMSGA